MVFIWDDHKPGCVERETARLMAAGSLTGQARLSYSDGCEVTRMATNHSRRLGRLEEIHAPSGQRWHEVIDHSEAELDSRMHELIASGQAKMGDGFICNLIISTCGRSWQRTTVVDWTSSRRLTLRVVSQSGSIG
jgi:hypothetical protein